MKIMQVNAYYPLGSTGKIVSVIDGYLNAEGHQSFIVYGRGPKIERENVVRAASPPIIKLQSLRAKITGYPYGGCMLGTRSVLSALDRFNPDVVHIHCTNGFFVNNYALLERCKEKGIRTVITLHASFFYTGGCSHVLDCEKWKAGCGRCPQIPKGTHPKTWFFDRTAQEWEMMRKAFDGFKRLTICPVSDWVRNEVEQSPFFEKNVKICTVKNGVDVNIYHEKDGSVLRNSLGLVGKKVLVHVTPNFDLPIKGGRHVVDLARKLEENPAYAVVVVGAHSENTSLPSNMIMVGEIQKEELLAQYYSMADVALVTSKRETYSMITVESLSCGTPVVGFKAGGPESIALPEYSRWVEQGDLDGLLNSIKDLEKLNTSPAKEARDFYSTRSMCENYMKCYRNEA